MRGTAAGRSISDGLSRLAALALVVVGAGAGPGPGPGDDRTFRPTVIVRKGDGQGSGTVIASAEGETLVLTAAHVVRDHGPLTVELHRYNLGVERTMPAGGWPVRLVGEVAAADAEADVAVVRVRGQAALPFVARVVAPGREPVGGEVVTSVGVDGGARLESWVTQVRFVAWFVTATEPDGGTNVRATPRGARSDPKSRPYLITSRPPAEGRSGGGLFLEGGDLVGVCVGRIEGGRRARGVFASAESVHDLLRRYRLDAAVARPRGPAVGVTPTRAPGPPGGR